MINEGDNYNDEIEVISLCSDVFATVGHDIHELMLFNATNIWTAGIRVLKDQSPELGCY